METKNRIEELKGEIQMAIREGSFGIAEALNKELKELKEVLKK